MRFCVRHAFALPTAESHPYIVVFNCNIVQHSGNHKMGLLQTHGQCIGRMYANLHV